MEILAQYGFEAMMIFFGAGAVLSLAFASRKNERIGSTLAHACAALASLVGIAFSVATILSGTTFTASIPGIGIVVENWNVHIDGLAAFFIATISIVALAASIYGISYQRQFFGVYRLGHFGFFYNMFLASMVLVIAANNGILFLLAWEVMTIASYFLVVFERREERNISAGTLYILISQLGAAFLFAGLLLVHQATGSWDFDAIRMLGSSVSPAMTNVILALMLIGFSTKAGVIPLHIWLPEAHPAAPSHVSALMSGVMIKTAIFMMVRFFIEFFPADFSWGLIILALGAISSLLGVLYALSEHDIKRLLAFHSVENIGIILLGVGASVTFFAHDLPAAGFLALAAGLYHTVNHALFKSLLFLSAGSVVHATHTRNMEEYGGLIRVMPWTAAFFLIGAVSISGLPPFNGFVSEWLTFQSLFAGIAALPVFSKMIFLASAASLALTGGLAAACFVKAFGTTFLARSRAETHEKVHESDLLMRVPMAFLALLTLLFGVGASSLTPLIQSIATALKTGVAGGMTLGHPGNAIAVGDFSALSMVAVFVAVIFGIVVTYLLVGIVSRNRKVTLSRTWNCGAPLTPRMEITATAFSRSIMTVFKGLLRPTIQRDAEYHDAEMRYFAKSRMVHLSVPNLYRTYLYDPAASLLEQSALRARRIQTGNLNAYILYIFLTIATLVWWALK